ncbi:hypothetical protein Pcinc_043605 [Petrolisthes cinctipes]|uniref:Uncharacterized protein n=1 Tax=Petrolisthes cinctipes TaxID=88211 RepID=A0AAE1BFM0_PETCI|nr:hypothetical protein Pcinc_043605 [Petrolisthes cinctipes]
MKPSPTQGQLSEETSLQPVLAVVLGVLGGLCLVVVLIGVILRQRYDQRRGGGGGGGQCGRSGQHQQHHQQQQQQQEDIVATTTTTNTTTTTTTNTNPATPHTPKAPPTILLHHDSAIPSPPPTDTPNRVTDEKNPDVIPQAECEAWKGEGVHTITSTSLPTTYATLPRTYHPCTLSNQQIDGGGDVVYSELALASDTSSPQHSHLMGGGGGGLASHPQHCLSNTKPHSVLYATLDHHNNKRTQPPHYSSTSPHQHQHQHHHHHHHQHQQHLLFTPSAPSTPTQQHTHSTSIHSDPKHTQHHTHTTPKKHPSLSHLRPDPTTRTGEEEMVSGPAWTLLPSILDARHTPQRHDTYCSDTEAAAPLIPNQKESSV